MVMPYHLHMPSYFLETFTEYPYGSAWLSHYSWRFKDKGKNKPFLRLSQVLLNGRLLQSSTADRTVYCNGLYGLR